MNRGDIAQLQAARGYPAVSLLLPTHRRAPENRQDPIRLKNLVRQARDRLLAAHAQREVGPLIAQLDELAGAIDFNHTLEGLAVFAGAGVARTFYLPFTLEERLVIDETFATRDLVFALNRTPRYWVLALSEKPTRLFEGTRETLVEVSAEGFPAVHDGPGGSEPLPGGRGVNPSAHRDERHRQFFRRVDAAFGRLAKADPLPLMLVGVDRYLAFFDEVSEHRKLVVSTLTGSHDRTPPHELGKMVWPLVERNLDEQRRGVLRELEAAVSANRYASTMGQVWRMAAEGRGRTLLVEERFRYPARLGSDGLSLTPADDPEAQGIIPDAVDELVEMVIAKGGRVVFVDPGSLQVHQQVALILRY